MAAWQGLRFPASLAAGWPLRCEQKQEQRFSVVLFKVRSTALAAWLSRLEYYPGHQKVVGPIPGQGN